MEKVPEGFPLPVAPPANPNAISAWLGNIAAALPEKLRRIGYRLNRMLPKDGSERMTGPLPLLTLSTANLAALVPTLGPQLLAAISDPTDIRSALRIWDDGVSTGTLGAATWRRLIGSGSLLNVQIFSTPGTATYTPSAGTNSVIVEVQAGGGGSGGCAAPTAAQAAIGGSGGGGGYAKKRITSAFGGVTVTVGDGGAAGASGANAGGTGGTSSFGALASATGGGGGPAGTGAGVGASSGSVAGGSGSSGDINIDGGGSAAPQIVVITAAVTALGGSSHMGGATRGRGAVGAGAAGLLYGGGANGAAAIASGSAAAGAKGGQGIVIVWEYA